jgi:hypothetical protein
MWGLAFGAASSAAASSGCLGAVALRPELRNAAIQHDALGMADGIETLVDEQRDQPDDREAAYEAVREWQERTPEYAYARAALAGRLAEVKGLSALNLITDMERWARVSMALNPRFRDGAARRMLGTLYVLAPARFVKYGDSEDGLELLEKQVEKYPQHAVNHLRLAEGYIALNDHESAFEPLCVSLAQTSELRASERRLLKTLVREVGGPGALGCDEEGDEPEE